MTNTQPSIAALIESFAATAAEVAAREYREQFAQSRGYCESPIEELLLGALLLFSESSGNFPVVLNTKHPLTCDVTRFREADAQYFGIGQGCVIAPQFEIGKYRVDFCILFPGARSSDNFHIVVECDGHQFHERTKEQARRDRSRDRFIQAAGFQVLRFTGSEIWNDSIKCVLEVLDAARREWWRRHKKQLEEDTEENRAMRAARDEALAKLDW